MKLERKKSNEPTYIGDISKRDAKLLEMLALCAGIPQIENCSREDIRPNGRKHVCSVDLLRKQVCQPTLKNLADKVFEVLEHSIPGFDRSEYDSIQCNDKINRGPSLIFAVRPTSRLSPPTCTAYCPARGRCVVPRHPRVGPHPVRRLGRGHLHRPGRARRRALRLLLLLCRHRRRQGAAPGVRLLRIRLCPRRPALAVLTLRPCAPLTTAKPRASGLGPPAATAPPLYEPFGPHLPTAADAAPLPATAASRPPGTAALPAFQLYPVS